MNECLQLMTIGGIRLNKTSMRAISVLIVLVLYYIQPIHSQVTYNQRIFYDDSATGFKMIALQDSSFIIYGGTVDISNWFLQGFFLAKIDKYGTPIWFNDYTDTLGAYYSFTNKIYQTYAANGYIAGASYRAYPDALVEAMLIHFDETGDTLWTQRFTPGNSFNSGDLLFKTDDEFILSGRTADSLNADGPNVLLLTTDLDGNLQWINDYGSAAMEFGTAYPFPGGGYIIGANRGDLYIPETWQHLLMRLDENGNVLWEREWGLPSPHSECPLTIMDGGEDYFIYKSCIDSFPALDKPELYFVGKMDTAGNDIWRTYLPGLLYDNPGPGYTPPVVWSLRELPDGSVILAGFHGGSSGWLCRLCPDGEIQWERSHYKVTTGGTLYDVIPTLDGGFFATGVVSLPDSGAVSPDPWLLKLNCEGELGMGCMCDFSVQPPPPKPTLVDAGPDSPLCSATGTLQLSALAADAEVPGSTGWWRVLAGAGNISNIHDNQAIVSDLAPGANVLEWRICNTSCVCISDEVHIEYLPQPAAVNAGADQTVQVPGAFLQASPLPADIPTAEGQWTLISGAADVIGTPNLPQTLVGGLAEGDNVFRWTVHNGDGCAGVYDEVVITYLPLQLAANAGTDQTLCLGETAQLSANEPSALSPDASGAWTVLEGFATFADVGAPQTQANDLALGTNRLLWTVSHAAVPSVTDTLTITILAQPQATAGDDVQACEGEVITLSATAVANASGQWAVLEGGGNLADPNAPETAFENPFSGENILSWTVSDGICPPDADTLAVFVAEQPIASAGDDLQLCEGEVITLSAAAVGNASGQWAVLEGGGNLANENAPETAFENPFSGENILSWTVSDGICPPDADTLAVFVAEQPIANAGDDLQLCEGEVITLSAAAVGNASGQWAVLEGGGNFANENAPETAFENPFSGENILSWTVSDGICPPDADTLAVFVAEQPIANAGSDMQTCEGEVITLLAMATGNASGIWAVLEGGGNFANENAPETAFENPFSGENILSWTVSDGICPPDVDTLAVFVMEPPVADAGTDMEFCEGEAVALSAGTLPQGASGEWSFIVGGGNIIDPNAAQTEVENISAGHANLLLWTVSDGICPPQTDTLSLLAIAPPLADAGEDQTICGNATQLGANNPAGLEPPAWGVWSILEGGGDFADEGSPSTFVNDLTEGENLLLWTVDNGICPAVSDTLAIVSASEPVAYAGADTLVFSDSILISAAPLMPNEWGQWQVVSGGGFVAQPDGAQTPVYDLLEGENWFVWSVGNDVCPPASDSLLVYYDEDTGFGLRESEGRYLQIVSDAWGNSVVHFTNLPPDGECRLRIYDITGRMVQIHRPKGEASLPLDAQGLPAGVYLLQLLSPRGETLQGAKVPVR